MALEQLAHSPHPRAQPRSPPASGRKTAIRKGETELPEKFFGKFILYRVVVSQNPVSRELWGVATRCRLPCLGFSREYAHVRSAKRLGPNAATLLEDIADDDLRLFAQIEFAAALGSLPALPETSMKQRRPPPM